MTASNQRLEGYDLARALAFFGMVVVNFKIVLGMGANAADPPWLLRLVGLLEGRAAATFVVLAGVGLTLLSRRARESENSVALRGKRNMLLCRALFLFVVGLLYTPVWPADILHFYGVYIAVGAALLAASGRKLLGTAGAFIAGFVVLLSIFDYEAGWNWETLEYRGFWTLEGFFRNLLFNGFHPVVPWTAFLLFGMWLGRLNISDGERRKRLLVAALLSVLGAEGIAALARHVFRGPEVAELAILFGTEVMPPMPLYFLAAGGVAVVTIVLSTELVERFPQAPWCQPLVATGQMALTLYVAHVILGMGTLEALGLIGKSSLALSLAASGVFCMLAILFSWLWSKRFHRGPLEIAMRWLLRDAESS